MVKCEECERKAVAEFEVIVTKKESLCGIHGQGKRVWTKKQQSQ